MANSCENINDALKDHATGAEDWDYKEPSTWKCRVCGATTSKALLYIGAYRNDSHKKKLQAQHEKKINDLRNESPFDMPTKFQVPDFEHFMLRLSVHFLDHHGEHVLANINRMLLIPEQLALSFKEMVLRHIPHEYVGEEPYRDWDRLFAGGQYWFKKPVPRKVVVDALEKSGVIEVKSK